MESQTTESTRREARDKAILRDEEDLRGLGYGRDGHTLLREMGGFSNFALSFSIISILTGAILLFGYGLKFAGPAVNTLGWPIVSLFTLTVAASMAELASAYPTAGGLYYWAFRLGGRGWAFTTAWLNMVGQVTITAGVNVAASVYLIGTVTRLLGLRDDVPVPVFGTLTSWYFQIFVMVILLVPQVLINVFGIRLTARLGDVSAYWHLVGGGLIVILLFFFGRHHNPVEFLFHVGGPTSPLAASSAEIAPGHTAPALVVGEASVPSPLFALFPGLVDLYKSAPIALLFVLGLLQAQWTYTGYDASAHVAEETVSARLGSAWGVFLSVAISFVFGYVLLVVLTLAIPGGDVARTAADPYPVLFIVDQNLPKPLANLIAVIIGVAMWLCGTTSITSMGRMWYAFARDRGMPGSERISRIDARTRTPIWAIVITSALSIVICLYAAAFSVITSISTLTLYLAYGIPILLNLRNRLRGRGEYTTPSNAPWSLRRWATPVAAIAVVWIAFITVVFSLPPNELVLWTMLGFAVLLGVYWLAHARRAFPGPPAVSMAATEVPAPTAAPGPVGSGQRRA